MALLITEYDEKSGLPIDHGYLECGLPCFLQESIEQMKKAWKKLDAGEEYLQWDCDFCNLTEKISAHGKTRIY